jgi:hypothetical protein
MKQVFRFTLQASDGHAIDVDIRAHNEAQAQTEADELALALRRRAVGCRCLMQSAPADLGGDVPKQETERHQAAARELVRAGMQLAWR